MPPEQRTIVQYLAIAATVVLTLVAIMYFGGIVIASGQHTKRALACLVLAAVAAVIAFFTRTQAQPRYR